MDVSVITDNFRYLMLGNWPDAMLSGAALTLALSIISGVLSAVLGLLFGIMLACCPHWVRWVLTPVLGFFRSIPIVMLIFWIYFMSPTLFGFQMPQITTVALSLGFVGGAYLSYSVASGIDSLPAGQWRAGKALGLSWGQVMYLIVLPQALPQMMPSFINQWVSLIKDTSLAYIIGGAELLFLARQINNTVMTQPALIYLFVGMVYFLICTLLDVAAFRLRCTSGKSA